MMCIVDKNGREVRAINSKTNLTELYRKLIEWDANTPGEKLYRTALIEDVLGYGGWRIDIEMKDGQVLKMNRHTHGKQGLRECQSKAVEYECGVCYVADDGDPNGHKYCHKLMGFGHAEDSEGNLVYVKTSDIIRCEVVKEKRFSKKFEDLFDKKENE